MPAPFPCTDTDASSKLHAEFADAKVKLAATTTYRHVKEERILLNRQSSG